MINDGATQRQLGIVSTIIPAHNRAETLPIAVASVLAQTHREVEVLIVDDGSTDDTYDVAKNLKRSDSRVRVFSHGINRGAQAARNTALGAARGEFVALLDSDDEWLPLKLERQLEVFARCAPNVGVVHGQYLQREEPGVDAPGAAVPARGRVYEQLLRSYGFPNLTLLIRRAVLHLAGGFDERVRAWQEWDLCIRLARVCEFEFVAEPLAIYTRHAGPTISAQGRLSALGYQDVVDLHAAEIEANVGRGVLSAHYLRVAYELTTAGDLRHTRAALRRAIRARASNATAWRHLAATAGGARVHSALRKRRRPGV